MNKYKKAWEEFISWGKVYADTAVMYKVSSLIKEHGLRLDYDYEYTQRKR